MQDNIGFTSNTSSTRSELTQQVNVGGYTLTYQYDAVGNRTLLVNPDSGRHTYTYDANNRLSWQQNPSNDLYTY